MKLLVIYLSVLITLFSADLLMARTRSLNVGSYNIRLNTPVDGENTWANRKERVKALIAFHQYDVIGVQEALPAQVADLQQMSGFASVGIGRDGDQGGEFSAILYRTDRIQVLDSGTFWLCEIPDRPVKGWDAQLNRICTWAKMRDQKTRKVFYYFNTHFDHIGKVARRESANLLVRRIEEVASGKYPVLCTGDFNAGPDSEPIAVMRSALVDAADVSRTPPYGPLWSFAEFGVLVPEELRQRGRIDYIFVNDQVDVLRFGVLSDSDGRNHPSDHYPLVATVLLK